MKPTVPPEPQLTRVQCGVCAWMSAAHESPAEAYLEVGAHFVNVHRYAAPAAPDEDDTGTPTVAAPPTVAPARPGLTHEEAKNWVKVHEEDDEKEVARALILLVDAAIERDRASRSPGPAVDESQRVRDLEGALAGLINGVEFGLRRYAETGDGLIAAALERAREAMSWLSPSAGQKGTEEP